MNSQTRKVAAAVALIAVAPWMVASAVSDPADNSTKVMIVGNGTAPQETRVITMGAGVTTFATDASRAWQDNAEAIEELRAQLGRHGITARDVRTENLNLSPSSKREDGRTIEGFEVRHGLTVVFRDIGKTGVVLDALVDAGANQVNGPRFSWEAGEPALAVARAAAIRDANNRAHFYARTLGLKVKRVVTMRDSGGYASGQPALRTAYAEAPTVVSPGEDVVRVSVSGEYELVR